MTTRRLSFALALVGFTACSAPPPPPAPAPPPPSTATTQSLKANFEMVNDQHHRIAEQMPEDQFAFQPTPEVRRAVGSSATSPTTTTTRAGSWRAWRQRPDESMARQRRRFGGQQEDESGSRCRAQRPRSISCGKAFAALTPATMAEPAGGRGNRTKIGNLSYNTRTQRALRQSRDLHAPEGHDATVEPAVGRRAWMRPRIADEPKAVRRRDGPSE